MQNIIDLWKKNNIDRCVMTFSCGGDSMNDTSFETYDKDNELVENEDSKEIEYYFDNEVYNAVDFYVNSDGHYQGEFGTVFITLNEDETDFEYAKNSQSEWSETMEEKILVKLTDEEVKFIQENVSNINGGLDGEVINYKVDCILTDDDEKLTTVLLSKLGEAAEEHEFEDSEGEQEDWYRYTTDIRNNLDDLPVLIGNKLQIRVSRSFNIIKDEE